jgi:hypothetical protein
MFSIRIASCSSPRPDTSIVLVVGFGHTQRDVAFRFAQQAVADHAAGHLVAFGAGERRVVDDERHRHGRRIDRLRDQRRLDAEVAEGIGDGALGQAGDGDDVACVRLIQRNALDAAEGEDLGNAALLDQLAVAVHRLDGLVRLDVAGGDAAGDQAAEIGVGFEDRADHPERAFLDHRRRDMAQDQVEQRLHAVVLRAVRAGRHPALLGRTVEDREVELLVGGVERGEQIEHLVDDFGRARVGAVDLVDDDDRLQADLQCLRDDELGLRQRAFSGVDQHQGAVHHVEDALDLAAEVGVAWRVDDVDAGVLPLHRSGLGENGDAALALDVVGVHRAFGDALVFTERAGLLQQAVNEGGLAMIDVCDDGDVAQIHRVYRFMIATHRDGPCRIEHVANLMVWERSLPKTGSAFRTSCPGAPTLKNSEPGLLGPGTRETRCGAI